MDDAHFLAGLRPELAELAQLHRRRCEQMGLALVFTAGWRSPTEQMELYKKGRAFDATLGWHVVDPHLVVTNAVPEHAPHCRGAGYDCAPLTQEKIDWSNHALFEAVARLAPKGLVWGGTWPKLKDLPHYELPGWRNLPLKEV